MLLKRVLNLFDFEGEVESLAMTGVDAIGGGGGGQFISSEIELRVGEAGGRSNACGGSHWFPR